MSKIVTQIKVGKCVQIARATLQPLASLKLEKHTLGSNQQLTAALNLFDVPE